MKRLLTYEDSLKYFKSIVYKTNEYFIKRSITKTKDKLPTNMLNTFNLEGLIIKYINEYNRIVVDDIAVKRFHPNNIDNKNFWKLSKELFPYLSAIGAPSSTIKKVNENSNNLPTHFNFFKNIDELIENSNEKINLLEIGFGFGNVFYKYRNNCNYIGIDYTIPKSLKIYKNFIEINKSGIPDYLIIDNYFDIIYSVNVFQHCSQQDRFNYIKTAKKILRKNGILMFSTFLMTQNNEKHPYLWGFVDNNGRAYTNFINQLTEVDYDYELYNILIDNGFEIKLVQLIENCVGIIAKKI